MAFSAITQPQAESDIVAAFDFIIAAGAPDAAARWYRNVKAQIESLSEMPERYALAPESEKLGFEMRQVHYGRRTGIYRIIYRVLQEEQEVHVLAVRHGAKRELSLADIE